MSNTNHTFLPEASQLIGADQDCSQVQALDLNDSWETYNAEQIHRIDQTLYRAAKEQCTILNPQQGPASWFSTFSALTNESPRRKRAKYEDPKRRAEVAQLRKEGACMRCHWNKTPV